MSTSGGDERPKRPKITKEEMKAEMLEHNYFDTEILFDGIKNERNEELKKSEKDLLDEATVKEIIEEIKKTGEKEYSFMNSQPGVIKKM
jgi:hypothetical protein